MNNIVIMLDSFRTDHLGIYAGDGSKAETPHINRFAQESLVFDRAYTGSFPTLPCRRDLFTGRWDHPFNTWDEMERDLPTMADTFRQPLPMGPGHSCTGPTKIWSIRGHRSVRKHIP